MEWRNLHEWQNLHAHNCPITSGRTRLLEDLAQDPDNAYLKGAIPEWDAGGDEEAEYCICGGRRATTVASKDDDQAHLADLPIEGTKTLCGMERAGGGMPETGARLCAACVGVYGPDKWAAVHAAGASRLENPPRTAREARDADRDPAVVRAEEEGRDVAGRLRSAINRAAGDVRELPNGWPDDDREWEHLAEVARELRDHAEAALAACARRDESVGPEVGAHLSVVRRFDEDGA